MILPGRFHFRIQPAFLGIIGCGVLASVLSADDAQYDLVLRGGRVVDGSGAPWYRADVAIGDGKIVDIGAVDSEQAERVLDVEGLIVAPGFIDMMGQTATPLIENAELARNLLTQGITTINAGEGVSAAPLSDQAGRREGFTTLAEYFALLEMKGIPVNVAQTIGHTQVRRIVLGKVDRRPSDEELDRMRQLVREAMRAGAIGVSSALIYPPAVYATTRELSALVEVAGQHGGRYYTHMRNEGDRLLEAIDEALEIGEEGQAPVHIFHLKAAGQANWGKMQLAIAKLKAARARGQQVTADIYPYVNNGLGISALIHPKHFVQGRQQLIADLDSAELQATIRQEMEQSGGWENWFRHAGSDWDRIIVGQSNDPRYEKYDGQSVLAIAKAVDEDVWETFFSLVRSSAFAMPETMSEANKILAMQQDFISFCTDVGPAEAGRASHPRAFGSFPRIFSKYVRGLGAISLEQAVSQASAVAANEIMAYDRGRIAEGLAADVIVFDHDQLTDRADFANPRAVSEGMRYVIVNGRLVLDEGEITDARPGRVLRGPGYRVAEAPSKVASGEADARFQSFDREIEQFMREHRAIGLSVAVTRRGNIVFSRGYGYADLADQTPVTPESLFRIASISKPITATAVLQLIEQGKLSLEDKVLSIFDYGEQIEAAGEDFDPRWHDITIEHLLQHRGGWDRDESFDAMFQPVRFAEQIGVDTPADQVAVIQAMLAHPLDSEPGEQYAYSNFGYCLLGRVIEQISGESYATYVQQHVLKPLGIENMRIGATRQGGRVEQEVRYYHPGQGTSVFQDDLHRKVPHPYGAWHLEAMDAHGGWIASATDLAKFAVAFDDPDACSILKRASIERMHARPEGLAGHNGDGSDKDVYYACGWLNRVLESSDAQSEEESVRVNHWHTGSLPGTATILIRRHDGINMVALLNSRVSPTATHLGRAIDQLLHRAVKQVTEWPE